MRDPILAKHTPKATAPKTYTLVMGGLHYIRGNSAPYFSLTCGIYERGRYVIGGAAHDEILKLAPRFADLAALHLSDINGIPMHCVENGWYWMGHSKYQAPNVDYVARHFRITTDEAKDLMWKCITKDDLVAWVETQKPRWKAEAQACIAKHNLVVYGDEWKEAA